MGQKFVFQVSPYSNSNIFLKLEDIRTLLTAWGLQKLSPQKRTAMTGISGHMLGF
jgi:hypothetical protein